MSVAITPLFRNGKDFVQWLDARKVPFVELGYRRMYNIAEIAKVFTRNGGGRIRKLGYSHNVSVLFHALLEHEKLGVNLQVDDYGHIAYFTTEIS